MNKLPITKEQLYNSYIRYLDDYLEVCDWVTSVGPDTICEIVAQVFISNGRYVDAEKLHTLYMEKVDLINLSPDEWAKKYDIRAITDLTYDIIENNNLLFSRFQTLKHLFYQLIKV